MTDIEPVNVALIALRLLLMDIANCEDSEATWHLLYDDEDSLEDRYIEKARDLLSSRGDLVG